MLDKDYVYKDLKSKFKYANILKDEPMSKHTSLKTGGPADIFIKIDNEIELKEILEYAKQNNINLNIIGNGTNLLVTDKGIRGITLQPNLKEINIEEKENKILITAGCGVPIIKLSKIAKEHNATGLEFAVGIPGTVGGAIKMNAGAYGSEIREIVKETTFIDFNGDIKTISNSEHKFVYRNSIFSHKDYVIIEAELKLQKGNKEEILAKMQEYANFRKEKQPLEFSSAGSTFKRGEDFITARLIDECGLKGYQIGDAQISEKHAGFIINKGNATAEDVIKLIEYTKEQIYNKFGKRIETEIEILN